MEETLKPRARSNQREKSVFQEMREQVEAANRPPSPPSTGPMSSRAKFDSVKMPVSSSAASYPTSYFSPSDSNFSPAMSQHSSPEMSHSELFASTFDGRSDFTSPYSGMPASNSPIGLHQQFPNIKIETERSRRSESVESFNLEETITETGISIDEIAAYIQGPDANQKWLCLFPECGKKFGRKENIKSHVQTHLGDRQYQCPHCKKCFVRQHDLKRHAKIHSGVKPYPCACGNSFARHDALTRHRQRGMCIGAFEGVVKKVVKRGRPRKPRPDDEARIDKASRTRSKNKTAGGSQSSASEYSESSYGTSPPGDFDVLDDQPFSDFNTSGSYSQTNGLLDPSSAASFDQYSESSPMSMANTFVSPSAIQAHSQAMSAPSPSAFSVHSMQSQHSQASHRSQSHYRTQSVISLSSDHDPVTAVSHAQLPTLPTRSNISRPQSSCAYSPAPELSLSSSSPAAPRFYDANNAGEDLELGKLADLQMVSESEEGAEVGNDTDMFLEQFGNDMMMDGAKFDEYVDPNAFNMSVGAMGAMGVVEFGDDVFFGSP